MLWEISIFIKSSNFETITYLSSLASAFWIDHCQVGRLLAGLATFSPLLPMWFQSSQNYHSKKSDPDDHNLNRAALTVLVFSTSSCFTYSFCICGDQIWSTAHHSQSSTNTAEILAKYDMSTTCRHRIDSITCIPSNLTGRRAFWIWKLLERFSSLPMTC